MPSYDAAQFDPPAPVARVVLRNLDNSKSVSDVPLLIDTGADVTLLPRRAVASLGIPELTRGQYELVGFDGNRSAASAVVAELIFLNRAFRGQYLLIEQDWGVLGRDVLNHVALVLDGPQSQWTER